MNKKIIFDKENEDRPYLAVNAVIVKKIRGREYILLGKRKNVAGAGKWLSPGGHVRQGEPLREALVREVKEETGLAVAPGKLLWWEENFADGPHHVTLYFEAIPQDPQQEPKNLEPEKCEGWRWFSVDEPPEPLWVSLGNFLQEYREKKRVLRFATPGVDYIGVGVAAVILDGKGRVLLQKRGPLAKDEVGLWKLPGGEIEYGETAVAALKRELREELGVEVAIEEFICCLDDILVKDGQQWLTPFYRCRIIKGVPKNLEPGKAERIAWFPLDSLPKKLAFGTKAALEKV